jgi:DNA modification methylase
MARLDSGGDTPRKKDAIAMSRQRPATAADARDISELKPDPENRREHNARNLEMIADSLRDVGPARSISIDENDVIMAGNGVVQAAAAAGITKVRIVEASGEEIIAVRRRGLTPEQKRALAIYDNRTAELATWNPAQLAADQLAGLDLKPFFFETELQGILGPTRERSGLTDPDATPAIRATRIKRGDLFELGQHRLLCGDSTKADDVARVMGGRVADLVFTSPPYGQQRDYQAKINDWQTLMQGVFANLPAGDATQVLVNLGLIHEGGEWMPYWDGWVLWMRDQGWRRFALYVWDQLHGLRGDWSGRFAPSFELVFHFNKRGVKPQKWMTSLHAGERGGRLREKDGGFSQVTDDTIQPFKIPDSVWRAQRQKGGIEGHPAPYSVALCEIPLKSWPGLSYEPFAGSGTTIIAAEGLGQSCFGIELEPSYCQVAIDRWEAFTGRKAVKVGSGSTAAARRAPKKRR